MWTHRHLRPGWERRKHCYQHNWIFTQTKKPAEGSCVKVALIHNVNTAPIYIMWLNGLNILYVVTRAYCTTRIKKKVFREKNALILQEIKIQCHPLLHMYNHSSFLLHYIPCKSYNLMYTEAIKQQKLPFSWESSYHQN